MYKTVKNVLKQNEKLFPEYISLMQPYVELYERLGKDILNLFFFFFSLFLTLFFYFYFFIFFFYFFFIFFFLMIQRSKGLF